MSVGAALTRRNPLAGLVNDHNYMWWATIPLILGMFIVILDTSIVNVALPHIMSAFGSNVEEIEWVSTGYMLSSAIMMPTTGFLGDRFGRKKLYAWAILFFTLTSVLCGMAWDTGSLIFFRVLQGVVGGAIQPVSMAIMYEVFPPEKRGISMAIMGLGAMFAPMIGPTIGGYLVEYLNWRWIFYINLPVGLVATFMALAILRESRTRLIRFDAWGFALMASFLTATLLGVSQGNSKGWDSDYILALFAVAAVSFVAFLFVELMRREPVINLRLFKSMTYSAATFVSIVMGIGLFGGLFLLPVFLQNLMGYDAIQTGWLLMPQSLAVGLMMPLSGRLIRTLDPRIPVVAGLGCLGLSLVLQAGMTPDTPTWDLVWWTVLRGIGMGLAFPAMNQTAMAAVPMHQIGQASGLFNVTRQIGGSFGIAMLTTLLTQRNTYHAAILGQDAARANQAAPFIQQLQAQFLHQGASPQVALQQAQAVFGGLAVKQASVFAFQDAFMFAGWMMFAGIVPALFMLRPKQQAGAEAHAMVME